MSCLESDFYSNKVLHENFSNFSNLFYIFVKEGFISSDSLSRVYFTYVLTLKDKIEKEGVSAVSNNDIIHVIWSLATTDDESLNNPIIPKLYERLHEFKRNDPLSKDELLELYQLSVYAQEKIKSNKWPKEFKEVIPKKVRDLCEEEYHSFDKNLYPDIQLDIAKKLLKLRTTFHENIKVSKSYRVDFKITYLNKVIVLKGQDQMNIKSNEWLGLYSMKVKFL